MKHLEKHWEKSDTWSQNLRLWWRNHGHGEMVVWGDTDPCCSWIQESSWTPAGTPDKGSKKLSLSKQKGSKIMLLCPSKCYLCAQGKASLGKSKPKYNPWSGVENLLSGQEGAGRQWQRCLCTQAAAPRKQTCGVAPHPTWEPILWALPSAHDRKESTCCHLRLPSSAKPLYSDAWIFVAVAS